MRKIRRRARAGTARKREDDKVRERAAIAKTILKAKMIWRWCREVKVLRAIIRAMMLEARRRRSYYGVTPRR